MTDNRYMRWASQTDFNVAVAPSSNYLRIASESIKLRNQTRNLRGERFISSSRNIFQRRSISGQIDVFLNNPEFELFMAHAICQPDSSSPAVGVSLKTFNPSGQFLPSGMTLDLVRDLFIHRYFGMIING